VSEDKWVDVAISMLLRIGVLLSIAVIAIGIVVTFVHHPEYTSSHTSLGQLTATGGQYPNHLLGVIDGARNGSGQAIVMAGLLLLIATPIARVALSIVAFIIERDRLYTAITAAVLLILLIGFAVGLEGA
jgi:uncharacterized membrane protein